MDNELRIILSVFCIFILTGLCAGVGIYSLFKNNRKRAILSFVTGACLIVIYLVAMFVFNLISF